MNRKYLDVSLSVLGLLTVSSAGAEEISLAEAKNMAAQYITVPAVQKSKMKKTMEKSSSVLSDFYYFNDAGGHGFVIVASDNCINPIVGYSDEGGIDVDDMPVQLKSILLTVGSRMKGEKTSAARVAKAKGTPVVAPLLTTKWNQIAPFNQMLPIEKVRTGCVATALAQILRYHQWPGHGVGSNTYTSYSEDGAIAATYKSKEITVDFSQSTYDYASMADVYDYQDGTPRWTDTQAAAVGLLMRDCGVALNMRYGVTGSGSTMNDAIFALNTFFSYQSNYYMHSLIETSEWMKVITEELDAKCPILFGGSDLSSSQAAGHAFVIDGYDSNGYLHANFGWGGKADGYYDICDMRTYNYYQEVITTRPNKSGAVCSYDYPVNKDGEYKNLFGNGVLTLSSQPVGTFTVSLDSLYIDSNKDYESVVALALYDGNKMVELLDTASIVFSQRMLTDDSNVANVTFTVPKSKTDTLADGGYELVPMSIGKRFVGSDGSIDPARLKKVQLSFPYKKIFMDIHAGKMSAAVVNIDDSAKVRCDFTADTTYRVGIYDPLPVYVKLTNPGNAPQRLKLLAAAVPFGGVGSDTLYCGSYLIDDNYTRTFGESLYVCHLAPGRYFYTLGYMDSNSNYVSLMSTRDSVVFDVYKDSTCMMPSLAATFLMITDSYTGKMLDVDNLRTGGTDEPAEITLYYKIKYNGSADAHYVIRATVNDVDFGQRDYINDVQDTTFHIEGPIYSIYQNLKAAYGITSFVISLEYKLLGDETSEWQPLDGSRPCFTINPEVPTSVGKVKPDSGEGSSGDAPYYTLQGVKIANPTQKGLYIHQGKQRLKQ